MRPSSSNSSFVSRTSGCGRRGALPDADVDVVAVEGDVELAELELDAGALLDEPAQPLRERHAAGVDPDERDRLEIVVSLDDLVRDPGERPSRPVRRPAGPGAPCSRQGETFDSFPASLDRVKGGRAGAAYADRPDGATMI